LRLPKSVPMQMKKVVPTKMAGIRNGSQKILHIFGQPMACKHVSNISIGEEVE